MIRLPFRAGSIRFLAPPLPAGSAIQRVYHVHHSRDALSRLPSMYRSIGVFPKERALSFSNWDRTLASGCVSYSFATCCSRYFTLKIHSCSTSSNFALPPFGAISLLWLGFAGRFAPNSCPFRTVQLTIGHRRGPIWLYERSPNGASCHTI